MNMHVTEDQPTMRVRTVFVDRQGAREKAEAFQRRGYTLSEIAEAMDCRRESIAHLLYWEKVRS